MRQERRSAVLRFGLPQKLSDWRLFSRKDAGFTAATGVLPYDLNTPLFSDYALKFRTVYVPEGKAAPYSEKGALDLPEGTILSKTFFFPRRKGQPETLSDFPSAKDYHVVETRLLVHTSEGWVGLPYIWNADGTEAVLEITGGESPVKSFDFSGQPVEIAYTIPNQGQCSGCHITGQNNEKRMLPIGPRVRQLNRSYPYADGRANQLVTWEKKGILKSLPAGQMDTQSPPHIGVYSGAPHNAVYNDPASGSIDDRARSYLDVNCAHCHTEKGPANQSGLLLDYELTEPHQYGVCKTPTAAGKASAGLDYDIVPGKPEQSILIHRMRSTVAGERMPELARALVHKEGLELVRSWILQLKGTCAP
jgi:uncharacterized repeat protein (TIGR03806 family)